MFLRYSNWKNIIDHSDPEVIFSMKHKVILLRNLLLEKLNIEKLKVMKKHKVLEDDFKVKTFGLSDLFFIKQDVDTKLFE